MAVQLSTFLSGRMENVIFYKRSGGYFIKSMPAKVHQSEATKIRSKNFGVAAAAGRILRQLLAPTLPFPKDKQMQSRFSGAIAKWLGLTDTSTLSPETNLPYVDGFSFNDATSISERCKLQLTVTAINNHLLQLAIPAFEPAQLISAPANTITIECSIIAASYNLEQKGAGSHSSVQITIPYNNEIFPAQVISLSLPLTKGCMAVTAAAFTYRLQDGTTERRKTFMPCDIIDARYC